LSTAASILHLIKPGGGFSHLGKLGWIAICAGVNREADQLERKFRPASTALGREGIIVPYLFVSPIPNSPDCDCNF